MQVFYESDGVQRPRIFGMTASPVVGQGMPEFSKVDSGLQAHYCRNNLVKRISSCIGFLLFFSLLVVRFVMILIIAATFDHLRSIHGQVFDGFTYFSGSFQSENLSKSINSLENLLKAKVCWFLNFLFSLRGCLVTEELKELFSTLGVEIIICIFWYFKYASYLS